MMNRFFDGAFLTFGVDVIRFLESDQEDRVDPMIFIFPRMTKCIFHKFGVSGEVETHDSICILPLNAVNEKIYVFLWFWFMILGVLSAAVLVYRYDNVLVCTKYGTMIYYINFTDETKIVLLLNCFLVSPVLK